MTSDLLIWGAVALIIGCVLGYFIGFARIKKHHGALENQLGQLQAQLNLTEQQHRQELQNMAEAEQSRTQMIKETVRLQVQAEESAKRNEAQQLADREKTDLKLEIEKLRTQIHTQEETRTEREEANLKESLARQELEIEKVREAERQARQAVMVRAEADKHQLKIEIEQLRSRINAEDVMLKQFKTIAGQALEGQGNALRDTQIESLKPLLDPLREKLGELDKSMQNSNIMHEKGRSSMETLVKNLMERAEGISADARNLTRALKGENKTQGDWGEMILEKMLENVGLRRDEEYFTQMTFLSPEGVHLRPDVIIQLPGNRRLIVDSKVSLTAYARACELTEDEEAKKTELNNHVASVRKHIAELSDKNYPRVVEGSLNYVLMFIPNESSYIAAVQHAPGLPEEAYRRNILLVSPTNMLMALQIAQNLWDKEKQSRNIEEIIRKASSIYDKLYNFCKSFDDAGAKLKKACEAFDKSSNQLRSGKGNALKQLEEFRQLRLSPKNQITDKGDGYIEYAVDEEETAATALPAPSDEP